MYPKPDIYGGRNADERLHQFEVVCRTALKLVGLGSQKQLHVKNGGLLTLGQTEFGLTMPQAKYCLGRARNFIAEARELERARNRELFNQKPTEWSYL
jgi:hypothetical protein